MLNRSLNINDRDEVEFPLRNILTDKLVLKAEFEDDLMSGKRRSTLWPNEKEDKKKKRRCCGFKYHRIHDLQSLGPLESFQA